MASRHCGVDHPDFRRSYVLSWSNKCRWHPGVFLRRPLWPSRVTPHNVIDRSQMHIRRLGLTRQKARYCHELAQAIVDRSLNLPALKNASPEKVRQELMSITGIGLWTSDIYLLMTLKHPDIWPRGDLALYQVMRGMFGHEKSTESFDDHAMQWRPWRSVAARILWNHYLKSHRQ